MSLQNRIRRSNGQILESTPKKLAKDQGKLYLVTQQISKKEQKQVILKKWA